MNAALLLEQFHRLGDAPDAVPRLRRFILDLAVRGKLVEQDPGSEFVPLSALCESRSGNSTIIKGKISAEPGEGLYPAYSASGQDVWHSSYEHDADAVIVSAVGARCGKAFMATGKWSAIANTHILFPKAECCTLPYLHLVANNEALWIRGGSAQPFVRVSKTLHEREVYLPTFSEQHRIVAKVEELMALCDRLEAAQQQREQERTRLTAAAWQGVVAEPAAAPARFALEQLPALTTRPEQVKALRQTILDLAVRGRLVKRHEKDGSAIKLTEQVRRDWDLTRLKKSLGPPPKQEQERFEIPQHWTWAQAQEIAKPDQNITYGILKPVWVEKGVPTVRVTEMKTGTVDMKALPQCDPVRAASFTKTTLSEHDLLISKDGTIGKTAFVPRELAGGNITQHMLRFPISERLDRKFIRLCIDSPQCQNWMAGETKGVALQGVNVGDFRRMPLPIPPLAEQRRIVAKVEELMALCDGLEAALREGEALKAKALEAVVRSDDEMIRRSDNGLPARPAPKAVKRMPRYAEAEVELAVAAEPAVHPGAGQAVVRRGPGRPPKSGALTTTAARAIEAFLRAHPGWHGKSAILAATGTDAAAWNAAIKELLEGGKVERQGEKKGARYRGR